MPAKLRPRPEVAGSITTCVAEPIWVDRIQCAAACDVSVRTLDTWTKRKLIPSLKIRGVVRLDLRAVKAALEKLKG
jgi:hypothetical protein